MQVRSKQPGADLHQGTRKPCWIWVSVARPVVATTILDELGSRFCRINCRCPKGRPLFTICLRARAKPRSPSALSFGALLSKVGCGARPAVVVGLSERPLWGRERLPVALVRFTRRQYRARKKQGCRVATALAGEGRPPAALLGFRPRRVAPSPSTAWRRASHRALRGGQPTYAGRLSVHRPDAAGPPGHANPGGRHVQS
jgi:hypothetical protein